MKESSCVYIFFEVVQVRQKISEKQVCRNVFYVGKKKKKDFLFPNDYMRNFFWTQLLWRPWLSEDMLPCKNVISFPFFICGVCSVRQDYASGKFHTFYLRIQRYSAVFPFVIWSHDRTVITQLKSKTLAAVMYEISDLKKKNLTGNPLHNSSNISKAQVN